MIKRKSIGIAVVIAALAVLVNVFALKSATVSNNMSLKVTNTTTSLIAITGASVDSDVTFSSAGGYATISLPSGANGVQPNSSYTFYPIFTVENNSGSSRNITIASSSLPTGVSLTFVDSSDVTIPTPRALAAGATMAVGVRIDLSTAATIGTAPLTVTVDAQ